MKNAKKYLTLALGIGILVALFSLIVFLRGNYPLLSEVVCQQLPGIVCMSTILFSSVFVVGTIMYYLLPFLGSKEVQSWWNQQANKLTERLRRRNNSEIGPYLQQFLFRVISKNREVLSFPLGQDATCLTPRGQQTDFRMEQIFFLFELVMPAMPDMDCATLRQILQSYLWAELQNYGVCGLYNAFSHPVYGIIPSVYVDRVAYDEGQHLLQIELLYIDHPEAAQYAVQAYQRDKGAVQLETDVYDNELG